ncbi:hypothetical protein RHMOL_Rhmol09G0028300 [Rhododendron molle]|uniref:Uncharacterized protein n=1 Tax=Rhododendron molle TaxID=49168 RepID=A0ACC0MAB5_RHOML|nr:hypothetical protein RHMOL_Rhmol09G0028300 [Rhododendron molle]
MAIFNFQILLYSLSLSFCILFPQTTSLTFNLTNLGDRHQRADIKTFGDAYISTQGLQLTSNLGQQAGKATYKESLHLWDKSTGKLTDFDTHFTFVVDSDGLPNFADGLAFFLAPDGSMSTAGGAFGLPIDPVTIVATSPFVAVEFDTFQNGWDPVGMTRLLIVENTIHLIVDLRDYLPEWVTIGFSASTGALVEKHTVKSWDFSSSLGN